MYIWMKHWMTFLYLSLGCFCPAGLIELGDRCVVPTQCPNDTCLLPPDIGPCEYVTLSSVTLCLWNKLTTVKHMYMYNSYRKIYNITCTQCKQDIYANEICVALYQRICLVVLTYAQHRWMVCLYMCPSYFHPRMTISETTTSTD